MPLAIDCSNYTGEITARQIEALYSEKVELIIVGLQYPSDPRYPVGVAHQQIEAILNAGHRIEIECYAESQNIQDTWANVSMYQPYIKRIWQAAEETHVTPAFLDDAFVFIDGLHLPRRAGIYTGAWFWRTYPFYGTDRFKDRPLWNADYDGIADLDIGFSPPYGGWARPTIKQFRDSTDEFVPGLQRIDVNWYEYPNDSVDVEAPDKPMTPEELTQAIKDIHQILYGNWTAEDQARADALMPEGGLVEAFLKYRHHSHATFSSGDETDTPLEFDNPFD